MKSKLFLLGGAWTVAVMSLLLAGCQIMSSGAASNSTQSQHTVDKQFFGKTPEGEIVDIYTLKNKNGLTAKVMTYGALLTELHVPDKNGQFADVVLGFKDLESYLQGHPYFGCTTGRYANRIAKGRFTLNSKEYELAVNNDPNHLHGGDKGLDKRVWNAIPVEKDEGPAVEFSYLSPDGQEGYPGNLSIKVTYTLTNDDELKLEYEAATDQATPVNLTNHSYFNLSGEGRGTILDHLLMINADYFTPVDATSIPTGEIAPVEGTVMDFRTPTAIGSRIGKLTGEPGGYDHNYVLNKERPGQMTLAARVTDPDSGRVLEISTTEPGVQLYTGNFLDGTLSGKSGVNYQKHYAVCLECQHFPDSPNQPKFPSTILLPGETYRHTTIHKFSAR